jgi:hypothetical protein
MGTTLLSRFGCYLSGHDYTIRQAAGRMFLYCATCGHRSDGIVLTGRPLETIAKTRTRPAARRHSPAVPHAPVAPR